MKSKKNNVLELFFNSPKQWHFEELIKESKITRPQLANWLKVFEKEKLILRVKNSGKMPYYIHNFGSPVFEAQKKIYALKTLANSGLLEHLFSLPKAKAVVIFGSFSRADWYKKSDIDLFIYGDDTNFEQGKYELRLHREIQVHLAKNKKDLKKMNLLLPYIVSGNFIKGSITSLGVDINA